jgi:hypothetical protein
LTTFVTSFTVPYLINEKYADLGGRVGYIYGTLSFVMVVATYFYIPELKGRTLEEVDQLFTSGESLRKYGQLHTKPAEEAYSHPIESLRSDYGVPAATGDVQPVDDDFSQQPARSCVVLDEKDTERAP